MKKFVLSVLVSIIMAIGLVSARPLVVNADSISGHQLGYNINLVNYESIGNTLSSHDYTLSTYEATYVMSIQYDNNYVGWIDYTLNLTYYTYVYDSSVNDYSATLVSKSIPSKRYILNGDSLDIYFTFQYIASKNSGVSQVYNPINSSGLVINDSDIVEKASLYTLQLNEIIQILSDIYDKDDDINDVLNDIYTLKQYNIHQSSFQIINSMIYKGQPIVDYYSDMYFNYPVFNIDLSKSIIAFDIKANETIYICFLDTLGGPATSYYYFSPGNGISYEYIKSKYLQPWTIHTMKVVNNDNNNKTINMSGRNGSRYFIPFYIGDGTNIDTELGLYFGVNNDFLNNIEIIAQGNQQSNNSSSDLEDSANEYGELADDVLGLEDDLGSGFSSSLNNVPTSFNFSTQFGNKFLHSATWVRNQFENMTTNTPFGALITFSLVLGLALLLVGRRLL